MAVKVKLDGVKNLVRALSSNQVKAEVAKDLIEDIKKSIAAGISPVFGERRFVGYKDPKKYPADKKPSRPVNMELTGSMLRSLTYRLRGGSPGAFLVGWFGGVDGEKADNHNNGITVPERRLLPDRANERFNASITRSLKNYYAKIISDILKKS